MVDDLLASRALMGASRDSVNDLLGIPSGRDAINGDSYVYWVGTSGIDDMWLEIQFSSECVTNVQQYPD
jgi:hypothetical protein